MSHLSISPVRHQPSASVPPSPTEGAREVGHGPGRHLQRAHAWGLHRSAAPAVVPAPAPTPITAPESTATATTTAPLPTVQVDALAMSHSLDDTLDAVDGDPLLLVLDGITDPHNLGACLRVADGAGAHAVIAPKDHAVGINATVSKVASGAADTVPYFMVTNLARTLNELKERNIRIVGTSDDAQRSLYELDLKAPVALVLGAEGAGTRQRKGKT